MRRVVIVGPLPPPVHGMAAVTDRVARLLEPRCRLSTVSISPGKLDRSLTYHLRKLGRVGRAWLELIRYGFSRGRTLYLPPDARWGQLYTASIVALGRVLGYRIFLHHHSFAYIDADDWRMRWITRFAGRRATHVLLCQDMADRFCERYPAVGRTRVLSNADFLEAPEGEGPSQGQGLRIGHLSNLCHDKGLDVVLDLFRALHRRLPNARLVLAGPAVGAADRQQIEQAQAELGDALRYLGPLDASGKASFHREIDLFVFPTRYFNEAEPLVVLEALAHGLPVIAWGRGCIPCILADGGGIVVEPAREFVGEALPILEAWADEPDTLVAAQRGAAERFRALHGAARDQLGEFMKDLTDNPAAASTPREIGVGARGRT